MFLSSESTTRRETIMDETTADGVEVVTYLGANDPLILMATAGMIAEMVVVIDDPQVTRQAKMLVDDLARIALSIHGLLDGGPSLTAWADGEAPIIGSGNPEILADLAAKVGSGPGQQAVYFPKS